MTGEIQRIVVPPAIPAYAAIMARLSIRLWRGLCRHGQGRCRDRNLQWRRGLRREGQRNILADKALHARAHRNIGAGAGGEETDDGYEDNGGDDAGGAGDALVVKGAGHSDLPAIDLYIEDLRGE